MATAVGSAPAKLSASRDYIRNIRNFTDYDTFYFVGDFSDSHYYKFPACILAQLFPNTTATHTITHTNIEVSIPAQFGGTTDNRS